MSDLAELFARDPLELTREDRRSIVEAYRKARAQFNLGDKTAGNSKKLAKSEANEVAKNLSLKDLGL